MGEGRQTYTDDAIIIALKSGSTAIDEAIRHLYREYFGLLTYYVVNNGGEEQDAEDIFQEVIISFVNLVKAGKFRGESSIKTFLYTLNRNIWLNERKRRGRTVTKETAYENVLARSVPNIQTAMEYRQASAELLKVVDQLGAVCKKILLLFYYDNQSIKEILQQVDYENEQVVRNKKAKCLKHMEQLVQQNGGLRQQLKTLLHG
ncbi:MAG: sigma-70 family RNA polymerase sigma factor [Bacteroidota bacterium]|nr:sigma-70 family RNA polymerase sigma factor [Bacteroidota bacterium]